MFEWDSNKNKKNVVKHNISFSDAKNVFKDSDSITVQDTRDSYGEDRFVTTGNIFQRLWSVVHTPRGNRTRLISARRANRKEKKRYENRTNVA